MKTPLPENNETHCRANYHKRIKKKKRKEKKYTMLRPSYGTFSHPST